MTESLDPQVLGEVLNCLFRKFGNEGLPPLVDVPDLDVHWTDDLEVSEVEMA